MLTANQINGILRAIVPAGVAFAVGKGWIAQSNATDLITALVALGSAVWSVYTNIEAKPKA
jgi:uncharacterized membrane protein HdeD (DUF308 family)